MAMTFDDFMEAIPDEYGALEGMIKIIFDRFPDSVPDLTEERVTGWIEEIQSEEGRTADEIRSDIAKHIVGAEAIMEEYGVDAETANQLIAGSAGGGVNFSDMESTGGTEGVMSGGDVVFVEREDGTGYYALRYVEGGIEHLYSFGSDEAARQALGQAGLDGATPMSDDEVDDGDTWLLGDAEGMVGEEGSYNVYFEDIMREAALEAGVMNPGMIGDYLADPDVQRIMAMGAAGRWGDERIMAEVRQTEFYQEVLYPGIKSILEEGSLNPEATWVQYANDVEASLEALGYARDADGSYRSRIGEMLDMGVRSNEFATFTGTFVRAEQSPEFRATLGQWYLADTGRELAFDQWFDVLAGTSDQELDAIVERATLQFQANQTSLQLDPTQIRRLSQMTQLSEDAISAAFSSAEQSLLAIGGQNLARFGLTEQNLIEAGFNISGGGDPDAPPPPPGDLGGGQGLSPEEVRKRARKAMIELGLTDDPKAHFFTGYDPSGRPLKTGLLAGAPEAG